MSLGSVTAVYAVTEHMRLNVLRCHFGISEDKAKLVILVLLLTTKY